MVFSILSKFSVFALELMADISSDSFDLMELFNLTNEISFSNITFFLSLISSFTLEVLVVENVALTLCNCSTWCKVFVLLLD